MEDILSQIQCGKQTHLAVIHDDRNSTEVIHALPELVKHYFSMHALSPMNWFADIKMKAYHFYA